MYTARVFPAPWPWGCVLRSSGLAALACARAVGAWLVVAVIAASPAAASGQEPYFTTRDLQTAVDRLNVIDLDGRRWTSADLRGRLVLIDFWATWCAPCLAQIPELKRLRATYGERFEVLGISLDARDRRDVITWLNRQGVAWPQVHDGRAFSGPAVRRFGVQALPASLLVLNGRVVATNLRGEELERAVDYLTSTSSFDAARVPIVMR